MATTQSDAAAKDDVSEDGPLTIAAAVDLFFGDLRLSPRTKKTYFHGIDKFLKHVAQHEGIDPNVAPVTALRPEHVTSFAAILVPADIRTPAISVPCGLSEGLPVGLQVMAPAQADDRCYRVAAAVETAVADRDGRTILAAAPAV